MLTSTHVDLLMQISKESGIALGIEKNMVKVPEIKKVIYSPPATIVIWEDRSKTIVKAYQGDEYSRTTGLALCIVKKVYGVKKYREIFKKHMIA